MLWVALICHQLWKEHMQIIHEKVFSCWWSHQWRQSQHILCSSLIQISTFSHNAPILWHIFTKFHPCLHLVPLQNSVASQGHQINFEMAITPLPIKLEHRSKAQNAWNTLGYLDNITNFRWHCWRKILHRRQNFVTLKKCNFQDSSYLTPDMETRVCLFVCKAITRERFGISSLNLTHMCIMGHWPIGLLTKNRAAQRGTLPLKNIIFVSPERVQNFYQNFHPCYDICKKRAICSLWISTAMQIHQSHHVT